MYSGTIILYQKWVNMAWSALELKARLAPWNWLKALQLSIFTETCWNHSKWYNEYSKNYIVPFSFTKEHAGAKLWKIPTISFQIQYGALNMLGTSHIIDQ